VDGVSNKIKRQTFIGLQVGRVRDHYKILE
jgi:calcium-dependent protein kinase